MITYDGWDREFLENKDEYLSIFERFMSQLNYENSESFETNFANVIGKKYAVSVGSATDALHFALLSYNIGQGDEVLVTDLSWISSASCISKVGATPVFCDIDLSSYHISLDSIKKMYTEKTKALIYVHLYGNMTDTTEIQQFCADKNIIFIEDAAQSLGSSLNGVKAGTIGDCSVYSFNSNKVIAGINGGGVLLTNNKEQANFVRKIRKHGRDSDFSMLGFNSRLYVLNSEIINFRFRNIESFQKRRQEIANKYITAFKNLPVHVQHNGNGLNHNYHKFVIRFDNQYVRDLVKKELNAMVHYEKPLSLNSMYETIAFRKDDCNNAKLASKTILSLPIHAWLTDQEVNEIINKVKWL